MRQVQVADFRAHWHRHPIGKTPELCDFDGVRDGTILAMHTGMTTDTDTSHAAAATDSLRKVVIVGNAPNHRILEIVANAGNYDVVIVESTARAYAHIKRVVPTLVVMCVDVDDPDGCQVLSMLKLDAATAAIPVVSYTMSAESGDGEEAEPEHISLVMN
jgi:CheY-like chemotaxis protein